MVLPLRSLSNSIGSPTPYLLWRPGHAVPKQLHWQRALLRLLPWSVSPTQFKLHLPLPTPVCATLPAPEARNFHLLQKPPYWKNQPGRLKTSRGTTWPFWSCSHNNHSKRAELEWNQHFYFNFMCVWGTGVWTQGLELGFCLFVCLFFKERISFIIMGKKINWNESQHHLHKFLIFKICRGNVKLLLSFFLTKVPHSFHAQVPTPPTPKINCTRSGRLYPNFLHYVCVKETEKKRECVFMWCCINICRRMCKNVWQCLCECV
jgi:hypothetical protein